MRLANYDRYNYFRAPSWRWERVLWLCRHFPIAHRCSPHDDEWVRKARWFKMKWGHCHSEEERAPLYYQEPALFYAFMMHEREETDPLAMMAMQARLLAGESFNAIAEHDNILPETVQFYEALHFDVQSHLRRRDWVTRMILMPAMKRNFRPDDAPIAVDSDLPDPPQQSSWRNQIIAKPFFDASLKMFAYFGGSIVCEYFIHCFQSGKICTTKDDLGRYLDEHWKMTIRSRSSQAARTFTINTFNVTELFAVHAKIIELERAAAEGGQPFSMIEQHVGALLDEIPWTMGAEEALIADTPVKRIECGAAELRDAELHQAMLGKPVLAQQELEDLVMPAPRRTEPEKKTGS